MFVYTCGVDQNVGPAYLETSCMRLCQGWRERRPWATWLLSRWLPLLLFYVFYFINNSFQKCIALQAQIFRHFRKECISPLSNYCFSRLSKPLKSIHVLRILTRIFSFFLSLNIFIVFPNTGSILILQHLVGWIDDVK